MLLLVFFFYFTHIVQCKMFILNMAKVSSNKLNIYKCGLFELASDYSVVFYYGHSRPVKYRDTANPLISLFVQR